MRTGGGKVTYGRREMANVFADFYHDLYARRESDQPERLRRQAETSTKDSETILPFSMEELGTGLKQLKNGKSADVVGVAAEMLKNGGCSLQAALLNLYNDIIKPGAVAPQAWKQTQLKVLFKSGDPCLPQNYRPISIIPLMYKLFSALQTT